MSLAETSEQIRLALETFYPCQIGDPVGNLAGCHFFPEATPALWAGATLCLTVPLAAMLLLRRTGHARRLARLAAMLKAAALAFLPPLFAYALGLSAHIYWGGPFNYKGYRIPKRTADVVIWFAGADDGTFTELYLQGNLNRANCQFGYHHVAVFSFADVCQALEYAHKLPAKSRLVVRGHSMGAAAALKFARQSPREILLLDTRDPTSWTQRTHQKPRQVRFWRNLRPQVTGLFPPQKEHAGTNYIGPVNMANLFRFMGGAWPSQPGAINQTVPLHDHHSIGNNLHRDPCVFPMPEI